MKRTNNNTTNKKSITKVTRRNFLKSTISVGLVAGTPYACSSSKPFTRVIGANDDVRVAIVGLRSKGAGHVRDFKKIPGVRVVALCDVDRDILNREIERLEDKNKSVQAYVDFRELLDNKDVDAVVLATPHHWHACQTVWACQAGKDVYVEKPVSHNVWEGRKMVEAAEKYHRIVQSGTQKRSDEGLQQVFDYIQTGNLGAITAVYGLCYKRRDSIGLANGPQPIPENIDYNLWTGPALLKPLRRERLHYDWHWRWPTGNGDLGNQGIHEMDLCRWVLQQNRLPKRVISFGGRFGYVDDGETPNTQVSILDYDPVPIIFEVQGLPRKKEDSAMSNFKGVRIGIVVKCENGYFSGGGGGGWVYDNDDKKIQQFRGGGGEGHAANFITAVRTRKRETLNADIVEGHTSSALCHLANISFRLGRKVQTDDFTKIIQSIPQATEAYQRFSENLFSNWVDLSRDAPVIGPWLELDLPNERFVSDGEYSLSRWANDMLTRDYREPFVVPKKV